MFVVYSIHWYHDIRLDYPRHRFQQHSQLIKKQFDFYQKNQRCVYFSKPVGTILKASRCNRPHTPKWRRPRLLSSHDDLVARSRVSLVDKFVPCKFQKRTRKPPNIEENKYRSKRNCRYAACGVGRADVKMVRFHRFSLFLVSIIFGKKTIRRSVNDRLSRTAEKTSRLCGRVASRRDG